MASRGRLALLAAGVFLLLLAVMPGHLYSIDGLNYYRGAVRLAYDGAFTFDRPILWSSIISSAPSGPIGFSLAYVPALILAIPFRDRLPPISLTPTDLGLLYGDPFYGFVSWTNPALVALTAVAVVVLARLLGLGPRTSVGVAIVAVFGTPLCFYGRADFAQPLMALLVTVSAVVVLGARRRGATGVLWLLVPVLALAVLARPVDGTLVAMTTFGTLALVTLREQRRERLAALIPPALGYLVGLGLSLASNWLKNGQPLEYGYGPGFTGDLGPGLAAWLLSPGRGILWYAPVTALAVVGAVLLVRRREHWRLLPLAGPVVLYLLVYSIWAGLGGWAWGPRFLVPVLPLLVALAALPLLSRAGPAFRRAFVGLALVGVLVNLGHLAVDPLQQFWGVYGDSIHRTPGFARQFEVLANGGIGVWQFYRPASVETLGDILWLRLGPETGGLSLGVLVVLALGGALALVAALARPLTSSPGRRPPPAPAP